MADTPNTAPARQALAQRVKASASAAAVEICSALLLRHFGLAQSTAWLGGTAISVLVIVGHATARALLANKGDKATNREADSMPDQ